MIVDILRSLSCRNEERQWKWKCRSSYWM